MPDPNIQVAKVSRQTVAQGRPVVTVVRRQVMGGRGQAPLIAAIRRQVILTLPRGGNFCDTAAAGNFCY